MKILVLGGTGFVGAHLLNHLARHGHSARVLARNPGADGAVRIGPGFEFLPCDVLDSEALSRRLAGCDALINLIGILNESGRSGAGFQRAHVQVVESAIAACRQAGVSRFLQMSGLNAGRGSSHYLISKGQAEQRLAESDLDWTVFQPSVIFGPGDSFINRFAGLLRALPLAMPLACPDARMQPVFVGDVAEAFCRALDRAETIGRSYQLGGPRVYTLRELVAYTRDQLGLKRWIIGLPNWAARLQALLMDFVPGKPFSSDNYRSLQIPSVTERDDLAELGLKATSLEAVVPTYLGARTRALRYQALRRRAGR